MTALGHVRDWTALKIAIVQQRDLLEKLNSQVDFVGRQLGLDDWQKNEVRRITLEAVAARDELAEAAEASGDLATLKAGLDALGEQTDTQLLTVLSPEDGVRERVAAAIEAIERRAFGLIAEARAMGRPTGAHVEAHARHLLA